MSLLSIGLIIFTLGIGGCVAVAGYDVLNASDTAKMNPGKFFICALISCVGLITAIIGASIA